MMRCWWAEVVLGWHRATRGALLWSLLAMLVLTLIVLPGQGDTIAVRLPYGLGLTWALLLVAGLWCGGTAYALDRERHRLTLLLTKPQSRWALWWGRYLGTCAPFLFACVAVWALTGLYPIPKGALRCPPELPDLAPIAQAELERFKRNGHIPEGVTEGRLLRAIKTELHNRTTELRTNIPQTYTFHPPRPLPPEAPITLRLSGVPFLGATQHLRLEITATCAGQSATLTPSQLPTQRLLLPLPQGFAKGDAPITLTLTRKDASHSASILFRETTDLALLLPGVSPLYNLTAFTLILLMSLLMAIALGLTLGNLFSLPVTLFVGTALLLAMAASGFAPDTDITDEIATLWARISTPIANLTARPFHPFIVANPLHALFEGEAITLTTLRQLFLQACLPWLILCSLLPRKR